MHQFTPDQVAQLLHIYRDIPTHIANLQHALGGSDVEQDIYSLSVHQTLSDAPRPTGTSDKTARVAAEYAAHLQQEQNYIKSLINAYQNVQAQIDVALSKLSDEERAEITLRHVEQYTWPAVLQNIEHAFGLENYRCERARRARVQKNLETIAKMLYISESNYNTVIKNESGAA